MPDVSSPVAVDTWKITQQPQTLQDRAQLAQLLRPIVERRLADSPQRREMHVPTPLGCFHFRREGENPPPGAALQLAFAPEQPLLPKSTSQAGNGPACFLTLPDAECEIAGQQLAGLAAIHASVLQQFRCRWDGALEGWSVRTSQAVPRRLQESVRSSPTVFVFAGDPGTGKSVSAAAIADRYCREQGIAGHLLRLGTEVRGNGTVGDFGNRVRAAFERLAGLPEDDLKVLVLEEAESVGMRRSEAQSHQEDRAGAATLLQCLDTHGTGRRFAVFCTTNLLEALDAALVRRAVAFTFPRPDQEARTQLLVEWLPDFGHDTLTWAAEASDGMTGCDITRALYGVYMEAFDTGYAITVEKVVAALTALPRTGRV